MGSLDFKLFATVFCDRCLTIWPLCKDGKVLSAKRWTCGQGVSETSRAFDGSGFCVLKAGTSSSLSLWVGIIMGVALLLVTGLGTFAWWWGRRNEEKE